MVDSVFQKISSAISEEVIGSWQRVFSRPIAAKFINLDWNIDMDKGGIPYIAISISDGASLYALHERSLGFRWFFLFLLFTRFKGDSTRPTLFLFDEPAANLHARAQIELLKSFDKILEGGNRIIYSTHSSHMISPSWIPATHIVMNSAIDYDDDDQLINFSSPPTAIDVVAYRQFVSDNPDRSSYFQPILERLEYISPQIIPVGPVILTEGISDFHAFSFYSSEMFEEHGISLLPGLGDKGHDVQISSLIGKGVKFIIVLDDDESGLEGAKRYRDKWHLSEGQVATLGELVDSAKGLKLETLISKETRQNIVKHFGKSGATPSKKEVGLYFSEAHAGLIGQKSKDTVHLVKEILEEAVRRLERQ